jgi:hypothetical protein
VVWGHATGTRAACLCSCCASVLVRLVVGRDGRGFDEFDSAPVIVLVALSVRANRGRERGLGVSVARRGTLWIAARHNRRLRRMEPMDQKAPLG